MEATLSRAGEDPSVLPKDTEGEGRGRGPLVPDFFREESICLREGGKPAKCQGEHSEH